MKAHCTECGESIDLNINAGLAQGKTLWVCRCSRLQLSEKPFMSKLTTREPLAVELATVMQMAPDYFEQLLNIQWALFAHQE